MARGTRYATTKRTEDDGIASLGKVVLVGAALLEARTAASFAGEL